MQLQLAVQLHTAVFGVHLQTSARRMCCMYHNVVLDLDRSSTTAVRLYRYLHVDLHVLVDLDLVLTLCILVVGSYQLVAVAV